MTAPIDSLSQDLAWMDQYSGSQPTGLNHISHVRS